MTTTKPTTGERGFTLIELSIATAILGVLLLMLSSIFINLIRQERAAVGLRDSIQSTRSVLNDIAASARLASSYQIISPDANGRGQLCVYEDGSMVHYFIASSGAGSPAGLYRINQPVGTGCISITYAQAASVMTPTLLTASGITATVFQAWPPTSDAVPLMTVRFGATSTTDLTQIEGPTDPDPGNCTTSSNGGCTASVLETSISLRGAN